METISDIKKIIKLNCENRLKSNESEAAPLLRCFKYFDLNNDGFVNYSIFLKSLERVGVIPNKFNEYLFIEIYNEHNLDNFFYYTNFIIELYPVNIKNLNKNITHFIF